MASVAKDAASIRDPAELESLGSHLLPPHAYELAPPELFADLIEAVPDAAHGLLAGIAAAAPPPLSTFARHRLDVEPPPRSRLVEMIGTLEVLQAWRMDLGEPVYSLYAACARPGLRRRQLIGFTIDRGYLGGGIKDGLVTPPMNQPSLDRTVRGSLTGGGVVEPIELAPADAVAEVAAAAFCNLATGLGPTADGLLAATLLLRAGGGGDDLVTGFSRLPLMTQTDEFEPQDGDEPDAELAGLLARAIESAAAGRELTAERAAAAGDAGRTLVDFMLNHGPGDPQRLDHGWLLDFLLGFVPRKVDVDPAEAERYPQAVGDAIEALARLDVLPAPRAEALARLAHSVTGEFVERATDPGNFGLAKSMVMAMAADGVQLGDEAQMNAWIDRFNGLPFAERDRLIPAFARMADPPPAGHSPGPQRPRKPRKQRHPRGHRRHKR